MASRKEQKERLRQERLARESETAASAARRKRMGYVVAGALVAAVVAALVVVAASGGGESVTGGSSKDWPSGSVPAAKEKDLAVAAKGAGCVLQHPKDAGAGHTTKRVNYKTAPPTSGSHYPTPAHDAAYLTAPKPYESLVHALEHGRVVIWFKPTVPPAVKGALKKLYDEDKQLVVLTANPRPMPYAVASTAWTQLLGCPSYNDKVPDAIRDFSNAYRLKGPERVTSPE